MQYRQSGADGIWVLLDSNNGIMIHIDKVGLRSARESALSDQCIRRTQGVKLVNTLCLDWDQTGCLKLLIRVFALITSLLVSITMWLKIFGNVLFPSTFQ